MSDKLCPFFRAQAVAVAVTIACQVDGVQRAPRVSAQVQAIGAAALVPDPDPAMVRKLLDAGFLMEAQRCIGERCGWWDHDRRVCGQSLAGPV